MANLVLWEEDLMTLREGWWRENKSGSMDGKDICGEKKRNSLHQY